MVDNYPRWLRTRQSVRVQNPIRHPTSCTCHATPCTSDGDPCTDDVGDGVGTCGIDPADAS
jgi:hypothetical protein